MKPPQISSHHLPHPPAHIPGVGAPPFPPPFPNIPPHLVPPELQKIHQHQLELQRFQEMQKLSSLYSRRLAEHQKKEDILREGKDLQHSGSIEMTKSESEPDNDLTKADITDDDKSVDNTSGKDEAIVAGRKRKSQNPIRITHSNHESGRGETDEVNYSSDDNDEGFPDPMDDFDEDDENLMDYDSTTEDAADDQMRLAKERKLNNHESSSSSGSKNPENGEVTQTDAAEKNDADDKHDDHQSEDDGKENSGEAGETEIDEKCEGNAPGKIQVRNDLTQHEKYTNNNNESSETVETDEARSPSPEDYQQLLEADIPIDKENPLRCVDCGEVFPNHFAVKIHYQSVHLKLMHKCTVDGCNAAFPSKRSRDRHSSNHGLHRKLLSTGDTADHETGDTEQGETDVSAPGHQDPPRSSSSSRPSLPPGPAPAHPPPPPHYQNEFLARIIAEQQHRLGFPFLNPGITGAPSHGHVTPGHGINNSSACKPGTGLVPPPFGMFPFNPLLSDMSRLPGLFHKPSLPPPDHGVMPANKMMEENLRKYMAMAGMVNKIENH